MRPFTLTLKSILLLCACLSIQIITGCDSNRPEETTAGLPAEAETLSSSPASGTSLTTPRPEAAAPGFYAGNYQFVLDTSRYSAPELLAFLQRVDEIASMSLADFDELNIAFVLQGSDIALFARQNYEHNKELVDLAARLDALHVIDVKVCLHDLAHSGLNSEDLPAFIERIPHGQDEMTRLEGAGYYML